MKRHPRSPVYPRISALVLLAAAALGAVLLLRTKPDQSPLTLTFDIGRDGEHWASRIEAAGPEKAYQEFKEKYRGADMTTQHVAAHFFGDILYRQSGPDALSVCDDFFAYGCYHVFTAKALLERGLEGISDLNGICLEKFGMSANECQHGIGHGLVEYFGYRTQDLLKALELCERTTALGKISGCEWGVFMQDNIAILTDPSNALAEIKLRKFEPQTAYQPCASMPLRFQNVCYTQIVMWWDKALDGDYRKIGELCAGIPEAGGRRYCFFGVGMIGASLTGYRADTTRSQCELMGDPESRLLCRAGAYVSFSSAPQAKAAAPLMCEGLDADSAARCAKEIPAEIWTGGGRSSAP